MPNKLVMRNKTANFFECGSPKVYNLMKDGFTDLTESKNPREYARTYVHQSTEITDVIGFSPAYAYSVEVYSEDPVANDIVTLTDNEVVGDDAHRDMVKVHLWKPIGTNTYLAYKRTYAVIPDSNGSGTEALAYTGTMKAVSDVIKGTFNTSTKTFNATAADALTLTFDEGTAAGDTAVTVSPALGTGHTYVYKTSANAISMPNSGDSVDHTWKTWDGSADITAANGNYVAIVEIDADSKCVKTGSGTSVAD